LVAAFARTRVASHTPRVLGERAYVLPLV